MLSRIVRVRCSCSRTSASARFRSVTSRVKQRVWTNSPSRHITLESISTSLIDPSLHRSRAGYSCSFSPACKPLEDVADHVLVGVEVGDGATDVLLPAVAEHVQFGPVGPQDDPVRPDPMQADGGILEEVGKLLLALPQFVLGGLPLDELADVPGHGPHHLQQVGVRLPDALGEELDHAERPVADDDRAGEGAVQAVVDGRGEAGEVAVLRRCRVSRPVCRWPTPGPAALPPSRTCGCNWPSRTRPPARPACASFAGTRARSPSSLTVQKKPTSQPRFSHTARRTPPAPSSTLAASLRAWVTASRTLRCCSARFCSVMSRR